MKVEVYKIKMDTRYEFPSVFMDAAGRIKKCEDNLRRTTRNLRTRVVDSGIFGNIYELTVIYVQQICHLNIKLNLI
jgi:hypothetical protein